jgi:hypothetical protein
MSVISATPRVVYLSAASIFLLASDQQSNAVHARVRRVASRRASSPALRADVRSAQLSFGRHHHPASVPDSTRVGILQRR